MVAFALKQLIIGKKGQPMTQTIIMVAGIVLLIVVLGIIFFL